GARAPPAPRTPRPSKRSSPRRRNTTRRLAAWCLASSRASTFTDRASTSSAIPATSGCCTTRWRRRSRNFARVAPRPPGLGGAVAAKFRVALSGDLKMADGSPTYPDFDLAPLRSAPGAEAAFIEPASPVRGEQLEDFDALILLAHRFGPESVPKSGRLGVVARFGVG